jgi:aerobic-type carbon monoxide dehydrogenase small subunit (CoxS/CutS family)
VKSPLTLVVNDVSYDVAVEAGRSLLDTIREDLGLTGTKEGCDDSECGACMVLLDGRPVNSCSFLAHQAAGRRVTTVEGLATDGRPSALQRAFLEAGGVQCGFCTPGMLISATALLAADPAPSDDAIRAGIAGNLCRCTGYGRIVAAVRQAARELAGAAPGTEPA